MPHASTAQEEHARSVAGDANGEPHALADKWYVVRLARGGGPVDHAYPADQMERHLANGGKTKLTPVLGIPEAVHYYMVTGRKLGGHDGKPVLTADQLELLAFARRYND